MRRQPQARSTDTSNGVEGTTDPTSGEYEKVDKPTKGSKDFLKNLLILFLLAVIVAKYFHGSIQHSLKQIGVKEEEYMLLVHVGRTGGMSIRQQTLVHCLEEDDPEKKTDCLQHDGTSSKLASQTTQVLHFDGINPHDLNVVEKASRFLVTMRNPLERALSAYHAMHPENSGNSPQRQQAYFLFTTCFPSPMSLENFCQAILPNYLVPHFPKQLQLTVDQKCDCRSLARRVVQGNDADFPLLHFNYQYFAQASFQKYPDKPVYAVRMEYQSQDLVAVDQALGGTGGIFVKTQQQTQSSLLDSLSPEASKKLCCVLHQEIQAYFDLFDKAINLTPADKQQADDELRKQCGIKPDNSWDKWRTSCQQRFAEPAWSKCSPADAK